MDARTELAALIRAEAEGAEPARASELTDLAANFEALPKNHPTARVLANLRPYERREFPNPRVQQLVRTYEMRPEQPDEFFDDLVEAIHPGMRPGRYERPDRPWWATLPFSPLLWLVWTIRRRRKTCPACAERVRRAAKVCRYCGHEFA